MVPWLIRFNYSQKKPTLAVDVDIQELAALTENYTGADLGGLLRQASLLALKESIATSLSSPQDAADETDIPVNRNHFLTALRDIRPSVSAEVSDPFLCVWRFLIVNTFIGQKSLC